MPVHMTAPFAAKYKDEREKDMQLAYKQGVVNESVESWKADTGEYLPCVCVCVCVCVCMSICVYVGVFVCTCECVSVCVYVSYGCTCECVCRAPGSGRGGLDGPVSARLIHPHHSDPEAPLPAVVPHALTVSIRHSPLPSAFAAEPSLTSLLSRHYVLRR